MHESTQVCFLGFTIHFQDSQICVWGKEITDMYHYIWYLMIAYGLLIDRKAYAGCLVEVETDIATLGSNLSIRFFCDN